MSMTRVEDLWTRFLSEGALAPAEEQELLRALETDEALRNRLLADRQFDGLIDALQTADEDGTQFIRSFQDRLSVEGDDSKFIAQVEEKIRHSRPKRRGPSAGPRPPGSSWGLALAAAGILAALLLFVLFASSERPATVVKTPEAPKPAPRVPVPEVVPTPQPEPPKAPEKVVVPEVKPKPEAPKPEAPKPVPEPPKPAPDPKPEEKPAPVVPEPKPAPEKKVTEVIVAKVDRVEGDVLTQGRAVQPGHELAAGAGLDTAAKSSAAVVYPDSTRVELGPLTGIADLVDAGKGKTFRMEKGVLSAEVVKQAQPMVIRTPHAEIRVLGTTLRITIDPAGSTRLDVLSGKVRLTRLIDGKTVDVVTGHYAVAGPGIDLVSKSSAPKPKVFLLQESFQDPRAVDARWKTVGTAAAVKTAGQLEIDLNPKNAGANGWGGGGLISRQSFAAPLAITMDVDATLHGSVVAAVVFIPAGQKRGGDGVFRFQLRGNRYTLTVEPGGETRDLAGADRTGAAGPEKWRIELDGQTVRFLVGDREVIRHKHDLQVPSGYLVELDGSARSDAPSGAKAAFDNVAIEPLK
jgi:hypothetical protein